MLSNHNEWNLRNLDNNYVRKCGYIKDSKMSKNVKIYIVILTFNQILWKMH